MRFADIVIDLAGVVKASRSVASKHLELRARQLDRYSQTSSIARSLREWQHKTRSQTTAAAHETSRGSDNSQQAREDVLTTQPSATTDAGAQRQDYPTLTEEPSSDLKQRTGSPLEKHEALGSFFQRSSPKADAVTQHPAPIQPDQSAILTELRKKVNEPSSYGEAGTAVETKSSSLSNGSNLDEEVPPDVNINIFHTNRGLQMLEGQKAALRKTRPKVPPPAPSWFKDFGHNKVKVPEEESRSPPSATDDAVEQGKSLAKESKTEVKEVEEKPQAGEYNYGRLGAHQRVTVPSSFVVEITANEANPPAEKNASLDPIQESNSPDNKSLRGKVEQEHTQMVNEILSRKEKDGSKESTPPSPALHSDEPPIPAYTLRESKVPATRLSRLWNYGGLAAGMLGGAISEGFSRGFGGGGEGSVLLSSGNMERLVAKLSRMRGAALKMGQMMSFQDSKMLPGPIQEVLQRVQDRADYMPAWQRDRVLVTNLGAEWRDLFEDFEETPMAAASIGQVHRATLKSTGEKVAVKIQFPGVADSINSDLDNLSMLLTASKMLPKGLYLNKTIDNARKELGWECDYEREAECGRRYRELLADEPDVFAVPKIYPEASGRHVLTMEFMVGTGVTRGAQASLTQAQRDWIGTQVLRLCLREITEFRFMQTDPNWTNFLYDARANRLQLLDFGASRAYPEPFVRDYVALLAAASRGDREALRDLSERLGYLTGHESRAMLDAHVASILTLAEPFLRGPGGSSAAAKAEGDAYYDFSDQTITERVKALIPVMIRERLSPPPEETYSLHRKLSGAFLLCARLGSRVPCRELFERALEKGGYGDLLR
ncbi:ABC1 family-domain-containing protein [Biscogniauxia marginata]|nr:ABC1 family-domain-containing protein [Biscogniauxia marginata]